MAFEHRDIEKKACSGEDCATVLLHYPFFTDGNNTAEILNEHVEQQLVMMLGYGELNTEESLSQSIQRFLDDFVEFSEEFSFSQSWEIDVNADLTFQNKEAISIRFDAYSYLGGAHPNSFRQYLNFDKTKAKLIKNEDLLKNYSSMYSLAEEKFRSYHEVEEFSSLVEDGRFFLNEADEFFLPVSMGAEGDEFVLYYNPYEIGPYVLGATPLRFPLKDLDGVVNEVFLDQ